MKINTKQPPAMTILYGRCAQQSFSQNNIPVDCAGMFREGSKWIAFNGTERNEFDTESEAYYWLTGE